jgi:poly-gamma-glutamate capsule biosynthesis protein CapA/YwtB (metallophosphatase superfamily)
MIWALMALPKTTLRRSIMGVLAILIALLTGALRVFPQAENHIGRGAKVFVENMEGFEENFVAALHSKQVPVVIVTSEDKADFFFSGYCKVDGDRVEATVKAVNRDGDVVFAYQFHQDYAIRGKQSAAEAAAKNLKKEILAH